MIDKEPPPPKVKQRKYKSGFKSWYVRYKDLEKGEWVASSAIDNESDAYLKATQIRKEQMRAWRGEEPIREEDILLSELLIRFFRNREASLKQSSLSRYRIYEKNLNEFLNELYPNGIYCRKIKAVYLEECLEYLKRKGQNERTLNGQLRFLRALFNYAVQEDILEKNPARNIRKRKENDRAQPLKSWNRTQVDNILSTLSPHWAKIHEFYLHTGLRKMELVNLKWNAVFLDATPPHIRIQATDNWEPKTSEIRLIPLSDRAIELIKSQIKQEDHDFVFSGPMGNKIHENRVYDVLKKVLDELGYEGTLHWWRHTFASRLGENGYSPDAIRKLLGHTTTEMTARYTHFQDTFLVEMVKSLDER